MSQKVKTKGFSIYLSTKVKSRYNPTGELKTLCLRVSFGSRGSRRPFKSLGIDLFPHEWDAVTLSLKSTAKDFIKTKNVVGMLKGSKRPNEYVIYTAHWDHIGTRASHLGKDSIFNGAIDNASGTAMQLEVAKAFSKMKIKPERSIIFLFTSAEEMGLFGAEFYANNPL